MRRIPAISCVVLALLVGAVRADEPKAHKHTNRLAKETSPYLLQHAHNPVDWYPWGPEAFARAKAEGRPVFLSVGYSTCYWCHVMERESFEDEAIAKILNANFVCIKVDREERPDVDQIYMAALQAFEGRGGWPMSLVLMPDGRPFFAGSYFPPADRDGLPGFPRVLERVLAAWRDHRPELEKDADALTAAVRRQLAGLALRGKVPLSRALADAGRAALAEQFDPDFGGFGYSPNAPHRPKFPEPTNLVFLLDLHRREDPDAPRVGLRKGPDPLAMVQVTLDHLARGGIRDHLAGGYHRYSTDRAWQVPHFEKMLYDQAQLASAFLQAFEQDGNARWRAEAESIFSFVAAEMTAPDGSFLSALDAETDGEEGAYYVWTRDEVRKALGEGFDLFARAYGLDRPPNFEGDRHVLALPRPLADLAKARDTTPEDLESRLAPLRARLLEVRRGRPAPRLDDKILTSWNGLMIAALADGARVLEDDRHRRAADRAADAVLAALRRPDGRLLRTTRAGKAGPDAYLDDYAFLAWGLLRLHAATDDPRRLDQARALADRMMADFEDREDGGFFFTADGHEGLLARPKDPFDNALPGGNSVAIRVLVALAGLTGEPRYLDAAGRALDAFSPALAQVPAGAPLMLVGLQEYLDARPEAARVATPEPAPAPIASGVVTARAALADPGAAVAPGGELDVLLTLTVRDGWHINANPTGAPNIAPTVLDLPPDSPHELVSVRYPPGQVRAMPSLDADRVALYEGRVSLTAHLRLGRSTPAGPATVALRLRYQPCNDRACLAPATLTVPLELTVPAR